MRILAILKLDYMCSISFEGRSYFVSSRVSYNITEQRVHLLYIMDVRTRTWTTVSELKDAWGIVTRVPERVRNEICVTFEKEYRFKENQIALHLQADVGDGS